MPSTDQELIQRTLAGEAQAYGELMQKYQGLVYSLAYHQVGHFADAQDIAQDAFIKAYRRLPSLRQPDRFLPWLKAITINECRMWRRQPLKFVGLEDEEARRASGDLAVETWARQELQAEVRQAVASLPEKNRLIVTLHYLAGLSHQEISEALNVPVSVVEGRLFRARRQLKAGMMALVEESFAQKRLPASFAQAVLKKLTLSPVAEGWITLSHSDEIRAMVLGVLQPGRPEALIVLAMRPADAEAILSQPASHHEAALAKARAFDCAQAILKALDIRLKEVVLYLDEEGYCQARAAIQQGDVERTLSLRPSDALALVARLKAPLYAEEAVVRQGKVGEEGLPCPFEANLKTLRTELAAALQYTRLEEQMFDIGLAPEEGRDRARFVKDEDAGTFSMEVVGSDRAPLVLELAEYRAGIEHLWTLPHIQPAGTSYQHDDGRQYRTHYAMSGDVLEIRFVPVAADGLP